ncbi:MAG: glycogen debranching protein GlgX [Rhizobiaceae bacterium]
MNDLGAHVVDEGVRFTVRSWTAERIWVSIFDDDGGRETDRIELARSGDGLFSTIVPGLTAGTLYGLRADGRYEPSAGYWFDPAKLLVDPYATRIDRPFRHDPRLAEPRSAGVDTADLVPKAVVEPPLAPVAPAPPLFRPGGLIYELSVRGFSMRHPQVPLARRGTVSALAEPAIIEHLRKLRVGAVELMPVTAWIDERHLPPLGLSNAWGYNPVAFKVPDPRLAPGGITDLRRTVATLRNAGIGCILDVVFNHTGESDLLGPTLSLRGLDNLSAYRHTSDTHLVNDTGCGNVIDPESDPMQALILDTLRHFVRHAGVDGFRFDLATILGRTAAGFEPGAPLLKAIRTDPLLADRVLIAEPWDIGADGYRLGGFGTPFLEWNDRYRDDVRRFWRGDRGALGAFATRLAGSSDVFAGSPQTRTVNFIAAHDGMTLADLTAYERKHNEANGEDNRDGHFDNLSWNNGVEGETADGDVLAARRRDARALLATLFASRGTVMLTAGDEFGRSQRGNNNAYAQDNEITWLDWENRDRALETWCATLAVLRRAPAFATTDFLSGEAGDAGLPDVEWLSEAGTPLATQDWEDPARQRLVMALAYERNSSARIAVMINGDRRGTLFRLPQREGFVWEPLLFPDDDIRRAEESGFILPGRSVAFASETRTRDDDSGP